MHSSIFHKNKSYKFQSVFRSVLIVAFSAAIVFGLNVYLQKSQASAQLKQTENNASAQQTENILVSKVDPELIEAPVVVIEDEKIIPLDAPKIVEPPLPIERGKNPVTRLDEAKIYAKPQILEGKYIDISLAHQNMVLFENGEIVDAFLISSGMRGMETPQGTFKIENKTSRAWSKAYSLWMPNWMAIVPSGKIGIHELPIWPGGYQEGAKHLGIAVSHGCVRLGPGSAKFVYDWTDIGTPVIVHK